MWNFLISEKKEPEVLGWLSVSEVLSCTVTYISTDGKRMKCLDSYSWRNKVPERWKLASRGAFMVPTFNLRHPEATLSYSRSRVHATAINLKRAKKKSQPWRIYSNSDSRTGHHTTYGSAFTAALLTTLHQSFMRWLAEKTKPYFHCEFGIVLLRRRPAAVMWRRHAANHALHIQAWYDFRKIVGSSLSPFYKSDHTATS